MINSKSKYMKAFWVKALKLWNDIVNAEQNDQAPRRDSFSIQVVLSLSTSDKHMNIWKETEKKCHLCKICNIKHV